MDLSNCLIHPQFATTHFISWSVLCPFCLSLLFLLFTWHFSLSPSPQSKICLHSSVVPGSTCDYLQAPLMVPSPLTAHWNIAFFCSLSSSPPALCQAHLQPPVPPFARCWDMFGVSASWCTLSNTGHVLKMLLLEVCDTHFFLSSPFALACSARLTPALEQEGFSLVLVIFVTVFVSLLWVVSSQVRSITAHHVMQGMKWENMTILMDFFFYGFEGEDNHSKN